MHGDARLGVGTVLPLLSQGDLDAHDGLCGAVVEGVVRHQLGPRGDEVPVVVQSQVVDKLHDGAEVGMRQSNPELKNFLFLSRRNF